jgi:hypothetical protein
MPVTVATLRAIIGLDDAAFQAGVQRTKAGVREATAAVDTLGGSLQQTGEKVDQAAKSADNLGSKLSTVGGAASGLGLALSAGVTLPLVGLSIAAVKSATDMDSLRRGLIAVSGSSQEAERQFTELREVAKLPGLGFEESIQGAVRLEAAGLSAEQAKNSLLAFGNAIAQVGKGKAELGLVIDELTRLSSETRVSGRSLMELSRQVPQLRSIIAKAFPGATTTQQMEKLGIDSKAFIRIVTSELLKIAPVTGGIKNAFENLDDATKIALADMGSSVTGILEPVLNHLSDLITDVTRVWMELPDATKGTLVAFAGVAAVVGPLILLAGGLITALGTLANAWRALVEIRAAYVAAEAAKTAAINASTAALAGETLAEGASAVASAEATAAMAAQVGVYTGAAISFNAAGLAAAGFNFAVTRAIPVLAAFTAGVVIGTAIMDAWTGADERAAAATDSWTESHLKSIPFLEQAYEARKKLRDIDNLIGRTGHDYIREDPRYQAMKKQAEDLSKEYQDAAEAMKHGFSAAAAEAAASTQKMEDKFSEALSKAKKDLAELKAPTLEIKLQEHFKTDIGKTITDEQAKQLANIQRQVDATKKLEEAQKHAAEAHARSVESFKKEIENVRKEIETLRAPDSYTRFKANAPAGTPDALIHERAALEDQKKALEEAKKQREEETSKIKELNNRLKDLGVTIGGVTNAIPSGPFPGAAGIGTTMRLPGLPAIPTVAPPGWDSRRGSVGGIPVLPPVPGAGLSPLGSGIASIGTAATQAAAAVKPLNAEIAALEARVKEAEYLKRFGEQWNAARIQFLASSATTEEQRIALETLGRSFDGLSPRLTGRIREMAQWERSTKNAKESTEAAKRWTDELNGAVATAQTKFLDASAATEQDRIALGFLKDHMKDLPKNVQTASEALTYMSQVVGVDVVKSAEDAAKSIAIFDLQLKQTEDAKAWAASIASAVNDARTKFLQFQSQTDAESEALGFLKDHVKDLPSNVTTATQALSYLGQVLGVDVVQQAKDAGKQIADFNHAMEKPEEPEFIKEWIKAFADMKRTVADFERETAQRFAAAKRKMFGTRDPAQEAWLEFLEKNDKLAQALSYDSVAAARAQEEFKTAFKAEQLADATEGLRKAQADANAELKIHAYQLQEVEGHTNAATRYTAAYAAELKELGLSANDVDSQMQGMIDTLLKTYEQERKIDAIKDKIKGVADDLKGVFENAFNDLREHGFKGFFNSIIAGFEQMLSRMAAEFLASQLTKLLVNVIGGAIGGAAGAAGGGGGGGLQAGEGGFAGMAASGGPVLSQGRSYLVGERGPELFVPPTSGKIIPNGELGFAGQTINNVTIHVSTPDANSFRRSQTQIMEDAGRNLDVISKRQGRQGQGRR